LKERTHTQLLVKFTEHLHKRAQKKKKKECINHLKTIIQTLVVIQIIESLDKKQNFPIHIIITQMKVSEG